METIYFSGWLNSADLQTLKEVQKGPVCKSKPKKKSKNDSKTEK